MKLRNIDFGNLPYPVKLKIKEDGVELEIILAGILVPGKEVYAGLPIVYVMIDGEMTSMTLPTFVEKYGDLDIGLLLGGS